MNTQPLLFSEPSIAETGVWCSLADGIDPAEWAYLCRQLGNLPEGRFQVVKKQLTPNPDSLRSRMKRIFCFSQAEVAHLPLVCVGPEGMME